MKTLEEKRQLYMVAMRRLLFSHPAESYLEPIKEYVEALEARLPIGALPNTQHVNVGLMGARMYLVRANGELQWVVIEDLNRTWHIGRSEYETMYYSNGGNYRITPNTAPYSHGASKLHPANKLIKINWRDRFFEMVEKLKGD